MAVSGMSICKPAEGSGDEKGSVAGRPSKPLKYKDMKVFVFF